MQILSIMILSRLGNTFVFLDPETAFIIIYIEDQEYVTNHACLCLPWYRHHS